MTLEPIRKQKDSGGRSARSTGSGFWESLEVRQLLSGAVNVVTPALTLTPDAKGVASIQGYTPAQIKVAYSITGLSETGAGQTIAIVDAYNDPNITSDLGVFDSQFGLAAPPSFKVVSQTGSSTLPATNGGWAQEISLDVEWAHAIAPQANILLVEAKSDSTSNLLAAVNYARSASGVSVVSMSWGGSEMSNEASDDKYFTTPSGHNGVTFVAAAGDEGSAGDAEWPAASPNVIAVGGTSLTLNGSTYSSETTWDDTSAGTSKYESTPSYQKSLGVTGRTTADVSFDADPDTGVATYDSFSYEGEVGWAETGGTSAGTPQWSAMIALADQGRVSAGKGTLDSATQTLPALYGIYSNATTYANDFNDITTGSNASNSGGGFGNGGFTGGGFTGGGFGGGGFGGGGHHGRGGRAYAAFSSQRSLAESEFAAATTTSSGISLTSAAVGYDAPTGLGTPKAGGLIPSLISYGSATATVAIAKTAAPAEVRSVELVRFRPAIQVADAPVSPGINHAALTLSSDAPSLNRPEPRVELDTAVGLARSSTSAAATADSVHSDSQAAIGSMSSFLGETQAQAVLARIATALKPVATEAVSIATVVAADAHQAAVAIADTVSPMLITPQQMLAMTHIDASATFCDSISSFTDELASIPTKIGASHSNARAWVITGVVIAADVILLARYRMKRAVFNDRYRIAV
jgi:hypothetical protein